MTCVSFPTYPLAMVEAERFLPAFVTQVEGLLHQHGIGDEQHCAAHITGCPNGCGRALLEELWLVVKAVGRYNLYLGGNHEGTRIPCMYRENINEEEILKEIDYLVSRWARESHANEGFSNFTLRAGIVRPIVNTAQDF